MGNARSRLTGPRTERAVVSRMTPAMSASSGQGTDQGTPKVRVTRLEYKNQCSASPSAQPSSTPPAA